MIGSIFERELLNFIKLYEVCEMKGKEQEIIKKIKALRQEKRFIEYKIKSLEKEFTRLVTNE